MLGDGIKSMRLGQRGEVANDLIVVAPSYLAALSGSQTFVILLGGVVVVAVLVSVIRSNREIDEHERNRRLMAEAEKAKEIRLHEEAQAALQSRLADVRERSLCLFELMPGHLAKAEDGLDKADEDFEGRAFAPFWDAVESVARAMAEFDSAVEHVRECATEHSDLQIRSEGPRADFPVDAAAVEKLRVSKAIAERLDRVVQKAQRDFEFSMIYEQRLTNQILIAGFGTLASALAMLGSRIEESLLDLGTQIERSTAAVGYSVSRSTRSLAHSVDDAHATVIRHGDAAIISNRAANVRIAKALKMLDNIQRRRRPFV